MLEGGVLWRVLAKLTVVLETGCEGWSPLFRAPRAMTLIPGEQKPPEALHATVHCHYYHWRGPRIQAIIRRLNSAMHKNIHR